MEERGIVLLQVEENKFNQTNFSGAIVVYVVLNTGRPDSILRGRISKVVASAAKVIILAMDGGGGQNIFTHIKYHEKELAVVRIPFAKGMFAVENQDGLDFNTSVSSLQELLVD